MTVAIALRAVHFAAAVVLFGEFAFALFVARPDAAARRRLLRVAAWALALLAVSGALWLAAQAQAMSGAPLARALDRETLSAVLGETLFGRVSVSRFGLAAALAIALLLLRRRRGRGATVLCALISGGLLASLAWTGHAAAEQGADRAVHVSADVLHLLAAGAWVGALWPLAAALRTEDLAAAARAARRFSTLGVASVVTLLATGVVNAWYTVGSVPAFFGTEYGRLLSAKLALFGAMLALAAINRLRLTPRLSASRAVAQLRRNALIEAALGLAVLGVVGALGVTVPALHVQAAWPFSFTLDWAAVEGAEALVGALLVAPLVALGLVVAGLRARRRALAGAGVAALIAAGAFALRLFAAPAYPTTYFHSPVRYSADSIARGAPLYAEHCAACHAARRVDLAAHWTHHREGDMFWWIEHGIPGTAMPGVEGRIDERGVWDLLNFLRARTDAEKVRTMSASVEASPAVAAPDFSFQVGTRAQESLGELRGRVALLVFYALPGSRARLNALADAAGELARAGVRVVALPARGPAAQGVRDAGILADPDSRVAAAYALFARKGAAEPVELLIDRQGWLRARWTPGAEPGWDSAAALLRQVEILDREPQRTTPPQRHVH